MNERPTAVDVFSGLGAWHLAGQAEGIQTLCFVEKDRRCQNFLRAAYPGIKVHGNIKRFNGEKYRGADIVWGGPPCQAASRAGKQRGERDHRWLWGEALRVVAEVRPRCCVFENPPGIEDVGLDGILDSLEGQGYEIAPVFDIPACAVGSPQLRHRYYIVAFANGGRQQRADEVAPQSNGIAQDGRIHIGSDAVRMADAGAPGHKKRIMYAGISIQEGQSCARKITRLGGQRHLADTRGEHSVSGWTIGHDEAHGDGSRTKHAGCSAWSDYVWVPCADGKVRRAPGDSFGLVDGLHASIIAALGNGQVPQIALEIAKAVKHSLR